MPSCDAFMSDSPAALDPKAIPAEIRRWNWGAFLLNWIWGIGNQTYIALFALIPGFGFIWMLVLGAKGGQERRSLVDQEAHAQTQRQRQGDRSHQRLDAEHDVMSG